MRWDLASHVAQGWLDYHLLATGRIPQLLWDIWLQGYWPPMLSLWQVPFYLVLGGGLSSALWSGLAAFVLTGVTGSVLIGRDDSSGGAVSAAVFVALLMSSPAVLAYSSVPMTEILGALVQLLVLLAYVRYLERPGERAARMFAIGLTILFFTKYNYFLLLAAPLVIYECAGNGLARRWRWGWRLVATPAGVLLGLYVAALLVIARTGGFELHLLGRRIAVHTIGNSGYVVLLLVLARAWYLHRRGRIDWARLLSADRRVRPLLVWFVLPVAIWFASPYPNHIRDFYNLVFNRPLGPGGGESGVAIYTDALRTSYFFNGWVLVGVLAAFGVAAARYRKQPPLIQCLIFAVPLQCAVIAFHQTRFPRFLLLTVVLLCLAAASELGRWIAAVVRVRVLRAAMVPVILACGVLAARAVVTQARFRDVAFENYTDDGTLRAAVDSIRGELTADDRLVIVGQGNELSPGMFRWELGPPSGVPCVPYEAGGVLGIDIGLATRVLLMEPGGPGVTALDLTSYYVAQRRAVLERVSNGALALRREMPVPDRNIVFRLYDRTSASDPKAACQ